MVYIPTSIQRPIQIQQVVTVHYFEYSSNYAFVGESHDFWEFVYVDKGEIVVTAEDKELPLKKGEMVFHRPGEFHSLRANGVVAPNLVIASFYCHSPAMEFFENRIKQYEELLKVKHNENWWNEDMTIKQLEEYFNKSNSSIKKAIRKMCDSGFYDYKYFDNNKVIISSEGVKWLCKNIFKQKYLELLEKYKMELTEMYIKAGYIYDEFFGMN